MLEESVRLFISYSHRDEDLRKQLDKHLAPLKGQKVIAAWHDRQIRAGDEWANQIDNNLNKADIILLLISPDFVASEYCSNIELEQAMKRHEKGEAIVVPIILEPCDWSWLPFARFQAFPKDAKAVTTWSNQNEAFLDVAAGIRKVAQDLFAQRQQKLRQKKADQETYEEKVKEALSLDGKISVADQDTLDELRERLGLTIEEAKQIEDRASKPFKDKAETLEKYKKTLLKYIENGYYPFSDEVKRQLEIRQRDLGIKTEDIEKVTQQVLEKAEAEYQEKSEAEATAKRQQQLELEAETQKRLELWQQEQEAKANSEKVELERAAQRQADLEAEGLKQLEQQQQQRANQQKGQILEAVSFAEPSNSVLQTQIFEFEVVTVDSQAKEISRSRRQADFFREDLGNGISLEMISVPEGGFLMGSPINAAKKEKNEQPQHSVTIQPFFMGKFPVTQAQWKSVVDLPRVKLHLNPDPSNFKGDSRPVEQVSWYEAIEFCERLSQKTGLTYRLPSEAEWEYACRAGTSTSFNVGEALPQNLARFNSGNVFTFYTNALLNSTSDVGSFGIANNFGLYDMHGNVLEWCEDHWHDSYKDAPADGQAWLSTNEAQARVLRGGSWDYPAHNCRSASRIRYAPDFCLNAIGFRIAVSIA